MAGDAVSTMKPPPEPDAEYIDANGTVTSDKEDSPQAVVPPEASPANPSSNGEGEEEEEILSPEDEGVRREWGGNCTTKDWERCNKIRQIVVLDVINNQFQRKNLELDCLLEPILCLRNGWTCNRCHIMCMAAQVCLNNLRTNTNIINTSKVHGIMKPKRYTSIRQDLGYENALNSLYNSDSDVIR